VTLKIIILSLSVRLRVSSVCHCLSLCLNSSLSFSRIFSIAIFLIEEQTDERSDAQPRKHTDNTRPMTQKDIEKERTHNQSDKVRQRLVRPNNLLGIILKEENLRIIDLPS